MGSRAVLNKLEKIMNKNIYLTWIVNFFTLLSWLLVTHSFVAFTNKSFFAGIIYVVLALIGVFFAVRLPTGQLMNNHGFFGNIQKINFRTLILLKGFLVALLFVFWRLQAHITQAVVAKSKVLELSSFAFMSSFLLGLLLLSYEIVLFSNKNS